MSLKTSDKVTLQKGRNLLQYYNIAAKILRAHYLVENKRAIGDKEDMDQLKSLGYVI